MRLDTLLAALEQPPTYIHNTELLQRHGEITALAYDSRKVTVGGLFIAVPGVHTDGRRFLGDAMQRGAVVALGEPLQEPLAVPLPYIEVPDVRTALANLACAFYNYPAQHLCTIGITGTDGKTTTANLISTLLETGGKRTGLMTTANFKISGQEWENATRQSTLEALEIQQFLRHMLDEHVTHAVIEATSHGLELHRVDGCAFDVGVVTNITHEHLDFHKTLDAYRRAKARLFEMLDSSRDKGRGLHPVAILNRDCLAAIAAAYSQGVSVAAIARGLATVKGVTGRMERIDEGQPFAVIVDYAHTPDSLQKVLATLRPLTKGKLLVVFGSAGERDIQKRPVMGRIAAQMSDFFVITDEDPRDEDREAILREIATGAEVSGKRQGTDFLCIADRTQAIATAFVRAHPGDTVLLAGKGHEQSIIIGREKLPWDDRRVAREQLQKITFS